MISTADRKRMDDAINENMQEQLDRDAAVHTLYIYFWLYILWCVIQVVVIVSIFSVYGPVVGIGAIIVTQLGRIACK